MKKRKIRMIDTHTHGRDWKEKAKTTVAQVLKLATTQEVDVIFDIANTSPRPVLNASDVAKRLKLVPPEEMWRYFLYVMATANPRQIRGAVDCWRRFAKVIAIKLFAGRSVGPASVTKDEDQQNFYKILAEVGYTGVVAVHCELEADLKPELWNPLWPSSHSLARPKIAEINSVKNQIEYALKAGFKGHLHICHVTCVETVELVEKAKSWGMRITCEVAPHHLLFSTEQQELRDPIMGLLYKVNPPLRSNEDRLALLKCLCEGRIDWLATDHAFHTLEDKFIRHLSGMPSLCYYQYLLHFLTTEMKVPQELIRAMTCGNILKAFGDKLAHFTM